ncbi:hypothetical protein HJG60_010122 [Phyllostomus discolor]|uniref:DUF1725 domain-containing protein n=1 Tax=Phyllostomus discolor TaxID=89673 RepID=A0A834AXP4_9CHIR|nr:hypothetical protein HJG60_010122 [Phyllostomus discolor]
MERFLQPRCPPVNEWIKKLWYIYPMEFYAAERKKELLSFATPWMELESIMLSKISEAVTNKYHMISPFTGKALILNRENTIVFPLCLLYQNDLKAKSSHATFELKVFSDYPSPTEGFKYLPRLPGFPIKASTYLYSLISHLSLAPLKTQQF